MRVVAPAGREVWRRRRVAGVSERVELAEARRARLIELGMEGEALKTALATGRLDADAPVVGVEIEVLSHARAFIVHAVKRSTHIVDEQAPRTWFIDQEHHARRLAVAVRDGGELDDANLNGAFSSGNGRREWVVSRLGECAGGHQQHRHHSSYTHQREIALALDDRPVSYRVPNSLQHVLHSMLHAY